MMPNVQVFNGKLAITWRESHVLVNGPSLSGHKNGFQIQFYWPQFKIRKNPKGNARELYFSADTTFRVVRKDGYFALGFMVLGFGSAIEYQNLENL